MVAELKSNLFDGYALKSYSQEGEDMILRRIFDEQEKGFYVDVGASHPKRFSNTYHFYKKGWQGINIDATPGSMSVFRKYRPRDVNLEIAISSHNEVTKYYIFNDPALNTFNESLALNRDGKNNYKITQIIELQTHTLKEILDEYLSHKQEIDFLNVDVEGMDLKVLESSDWQKYTPKVVLCEALSSELDDIKNDTTYKFLESKGYSLQAKTFNTLIFKINGK